MGATKTKKQTFAQKLRVEIDRRQWGIRTLARAVVAVEPPVEDRDKRIDNVRRQLREYLKDTVVPTDRTRHTIEDALEMKRDSLKGDEDEEGRSVSPRSIRHGAELFFDLVVEAAARAAVAQVRAEAHAEELQES